MDASLAITGHTVATVVDVCVRTDACLGAAIFKSCARQSNLYSFIVFYELVLYKYIRLLSWMCALAVATRAARYTAITSEDYLRVLVLN